MIGTLVLPGALRERIASEARAAYPAECCGLIVGERKVGGIVHASACHAMRNLAGDNDRFEIDPSQQLALLRSLRGSGCEVIGCYHSHPNGAPEPSPRDLAGAAEEDFLWLIWAQTRLAAFVYAAGAFHPVRLA